MARAQQPQLMIQPLYATDPQHLRAVSGYNNHHKSSSQKIPVCDRNLASGWPLLTVTRFCNDSAWATQPPGIYYSLTHAGGACHDITHSLFSFARLLCKLPTIHLSLRIGEEQHVAKSEIAREQLLKKLEAVYLGHNNFEFELEVQSLNLLISHRVSKMGGGFKPSIRYHGNDCGGSFYEETHLSAYAQANIPTNLINADPPIAEMDIVKQVAITGLFDSGNIIIDLGELLAHRRLSAVENLTVTLSMLFQVEAFQQLKTDTALQPSMGSHMLSQVADCSLLYSTKPSADRTTPSAQRAGSIPGMRKLTLV